MNVTFVSSGISGSAYTRISADPSAFRVNCRPMRLPAGVLKSAAKRHRRSEEHTSELQSRLHLVCRLLLEKKKHNGPIANLVRVVQELIASVGLVIVDLNLAYLLLSYHDNADNIALD